MTRSLFSLPLPFSLSLLSLLSLFSLSLSVKVCEYELKGALFHLPHLSHYSLQRYGQIEWTICNPKLTNCSGYVCLANISLFPLSSQHKSSLDFDQKTRESTGYILRPDHKEEPMDLQEPLDVFQKAILNQERLSDQIRMREEGEDKKRQERERWRRKKEREGWENVGDKIISIRRNGSGPIEFQFTRSSPDCIEDLKTTIRLHCLTKFPHTHLNGILSSFYTLKRKECHIDIELFLVQDCPLSWPNEALSPLSTSPALPHSPIFLPPTPTPTPTPTPIPIPTLTSTMLTQISSFVKSLTSPTNNITTSTSTSTTVTTPAASLTNLKNQLVDPYTINVVDVTSMELLRNLKCHVLTPDGLLFLGRGRAISENQELIWDFCEPLREEKCNQSSVCLITTDSESSSGPGIHTKGKKDDDGKIYTLLGEIDMNHLHLEWNSGFVIVHIFQDYEVTENIDNNNYNDISNDISNDINNFDDISNDINNFDDVNNEPNKEGDDKECRRVITSFWYVCQRLHSVELIFKKCHVSVVMYGLQSCSSRLSIPNPFECGGEMNSGMWIDLSLFPQMSFSDSEYHYSLNLCSPLRISGGCENAYLCQQKEDTVHSAGNTKLDIFDSEKRGHLDFIGVDISYVDGDPGCWKSRTFEVNLNCNPKQESPLVNLIESDLCLYTVIIETKGACPPDWINWCGLTEQIDPFESISPVHPPFQKEDRKLTEEYKQTLHLKVEKEVIEAQKKLSESLPRFNPF